MNKAFVREPDADGRAYCPQCGALGIAVGAATLDAHVREDSRKRLGDAAFFCSFDRCSVAYFTELGTVVSVEALRSPVYPKDPAMPMCACFGFALADLEADIREGTPRRIRELLAKSRSPAARCAALSADGQCCMQTVQGMYMRRLAGQNE